MSCWCLNVWLNFSVSSCKARSALFFGDTRGGGSAGCCFGDVCGGGGGGGGDDDDDVDGGGGGFDFLGLKVTFRSLQQSSQRPTPKPLELPSHAWSLQNVGAVARFDPARGAGSELIQTTQSDGCKNSLIS